MKIAKIKIIFCRFKNVSARYPPTIIRPLAMPIWVVVNKPNSTADSPNSLSRLGSISENKLIYQWIIMCPKVIQYKKISRSLLSCEKFNTRSPILD